MICMHGQQCPLCPSVSCSRCEIVLALVSCGRSEKKVLSPSALLPKEADARSAEPATENLPRMAPRAGLTATEERRCAMVLDRRGPSAAIYPGRAFSHQHQPSDVLSSARKMQRQQNTCDVRRGSASAAAVARVDCRRGPPEPAVALGCLPSAADCLREAASALAAGASVPDGLRERGSAAARLEVRRAAAAALLRRACCSCPPAPALCAAAASSLAASDSSP